MSFVDTLLICSSARKIFFFFFTGDPERETILTGPYEQTNYTFVR